MLFSIILFLLSLTALLISAHYFVDFSHQYAEEKQYSHLAVSIILMSLLTSVPEIIVTLLASQKGYYLMAIGNALGSCIVNLGLVFTIMFLLMPLAIDRSTWKRDLLAQWLIITVVIIILYTGVLTITASALLCLISLSYLILCAQGDPSSTVRTKTGSHWRTLSLMSLTALSLVISAHFFLEVTANIAKQCQLSEEVTGLTVVAIGTSLPELAACLAAYRKKLNNMVLGNIIGSNIYNLTLVLACPNLMKASITLPADLLHDGWVIVALTLYMMTCLKMDAWMQEKHPAWSDGLRRGWAISGLGTYVLYLVSVVR